MTNFAFLTRWMSLCVLAAGLAGCASPEMPFPPPPAEPARTAAVEPRQAPLQCVPFARDHSDVKIYGDAWTWWGQASGKYPENPSPQSGSVMVLNGYAGPQRAHVAVVRQIISPREIRVDHANWLDDGSIYLNDPVVDVSAGNDWSQVRVFNIKAGAWGGKVYPVQGFIGGSPPDSRREVPDSPPPPDLSSLIASAGVQKSPN